MNFTVLKGDDLGVYHDDNYRMVECYDGHIVFSFAQKGKAMTAHIASDKIGLRSIKAAIVYFCQWLFGQYEWCRFIYAAIAKELKSMMRIVVKCAFIYLSDDSKHCIYSRAR